jgi:thioredoxin-related protein
MAKIKKILQQFGFLWILACVLGTARAGEAPPLDVADNLAQIGKLAAARAVPVMLVFVQSDCKHCTRAEKEFIEPLRVSQNYGNKVIVREIEIAKTTRLNDFNGRPTTHSAFAKSYEVASVPTVIVVDPHGKILSDPIVGLAAPDLYRLYLEQAIDNGRLAMHVH